MAVLILGKVMPSSPGAEHERRIDCFETAEGRSEMSE